MDEIMGYIISFMGSLWRNAMDRLLPLSGWTNAWTKQAACVKPSPSLPFWGQNLCKEITQGHIIVTAPEGLCLKQDTMKIWISPSVQGQLNLKQNKQAVPPTPHTSIPTTGYYANIKIIMALPVWYDTFF